MTNKEKNTNQQNKKGLGILTRDYIIELFEKAEKLRSEALQNKTQGKEKIK